MGDAGVSGTGSAGLEEQRTEGGIHLEEFPPVEAPLFVEEDPWAIAKYGRRHAPRIAPPDGEPVACALKPVRGEACPGEVRDLSALGIGIWVEAAEAAALEHTVGVQLYLSFENTGDGLELDATIRRRSVQGDRLFLACEIESLGTPAQRAGRERLAAWVGERFARG